TAAKAASERILRLRDKIPNHVTIGISGDALAATGLNAGCEIWYSVIGGVFPNVALALTKAARTGDSTLAIQISDNLTYLWEIFKNNGGSLRVVAAIAEEIGLVSAPSLPLPLHSIHGDEREKIVSLIRTLSLS
ncbi:MAG: dihydrodipicolinate synthase family protein, partial [Shewanella sp.]